MKNKLIVTTMLFGVAGTLLAASSDARGSAARACKVQGVWERVATISAGKRTEFVGARQQKAVTKKHFIWLTGVSRRDTLPLRTALDSAIAFGVAGGSGTYDVSGNKYTEHVELFVDPRLEGKSLTSSCRISGNQWYHTFLGSDIDLPVAGRPAVVDSTTEIWRRIE